MDAGAPFAPHAPEYRHASSVRADAHDLFVYLSRRRRAEAVPLTGAFKKSKSCEKRKAPHIAHCKGGHRKAIWEVHGRPFVLAESLQLHSANGSEAQGPGLAAGLHAAVVLHLNPSYMSFHIRIPCIASGQLLDIVPENLGCRTSWRQNQSGIKSCGLQPCR